MSWKITTSNFILLFTIFNLTIYNIPLYIFSIENLAILTLSGVHTFLTILVVVFLFTSIIFLTFALISQHLIKPLAIIISATNSVAIYFVVTYKVMLDKTMIGNIFNTSLAESTDFLHYKMFIYIVLLGALPSLFLFKFKLQMVSRLKLLSLFAIIFVTSSLWIYSASSTWLWFDNNGKKLGGIVMPWSYVINTARYYDEQAKKNIKQTLLPDASFKNNNKHIVILIIGESARAQNFSLYGYDRQTNPLLSKQDVTTFKNTDACATYTTASISCMLSHTKTGMLQVNYEPLPSYLSRQGVDVIWRANNWGEPKIKVNSYLHASEIRKNCVGEGCAYDEVLFKGLADRIRASKKQNIFIVLHQTGSHGPSYYKKYPKKFEVFKPTCQSVELQQCTQQELINSYDNTILYTDYFINRAINLLKKFTNSATSLIYASDHGESLGEYGLYLHGTPLSIAPDEQKKVPFIVWSSNKTTKTKIEQHYGHQHIFHSVLGALDIKSPVYDANNDVFN